MKYSEYTSKPKFKGSAAFYIIIACCLLALGGASWFAASSISRRNNDSSSAPSQISEPPQSSIPDSQPEPSSTVSENVGKNVSDEPYSSAESTASKTESKPQKKVFTMPVQGDIIKKYSDKELQFSATSSDMRIHTGLDIACADGTSVSACGDGKVLSVEETAFLGNVVTIDHGDGITTKYAALKDIKVKAGAKVTAGDIIGAVTSVPGECADQSHLHLEVYKDGHVTEPLKALGLK